MSTPEELAAQAEAVSRVRAARVERDRVTKAASRRLRKAIIEAIELGAAVKDVAAAAELSRQRIHQLISEED